jgi:hypothetical protein
MSASGTGNVVTAAPGASDTTDDLVVLAAEINVAHAAFERATARAILSAHHAGALLIEAKGKVGHGQWAPWLKTHFEGTQRTAQRYIRLARAYPDTTRLSHLTLTTALEAMATPKERAPRGDSERRDRTARDDPEQPSEQFVFLTVFEVLHSANDSAEAQAWAERWESKLTASRGVAQALYSTKLCGSEDAT